MMVHIHDGSCYSYFHVYMQKCNQQAPVLICSRTLHADRSPCRADRLGEAQLENSEINQFHLIVLMMMVCHLY
jgi:hypothetical protein